MIYDADYWNNKYIKQRVIYAGRTQRNDNRPIDIDVKNFITANDNILQIYIEQYGLKKDTHNETALAIQKFVVANLKYISDSQGSGVNEYWKFPFETLNDINNGKADDCEDGAILMASLMINCGIPSHRVKVCAGYVKPSDTAPTSGHCYCIYLADRLDGSQEWEIHDWCYYEDTDVVTGSKPLLKDGGYNNCYKDMWWSFNNQYSWSSTEVTIDSGRVKEVL